MACNIYSIIYFDLGSPASSALLSAVALTLTAAVCRETIAEVSSKERLFECIFILSLKYHPLPIPQSIVSGSFWQIIVSPEIVTSAPFQAGVLSKTKFKDHLHAVCIDKAHCVSLWGGSFHPDYAELGVL